MGESAGAANYTGSGNVFIGNGIFETGSNKLFISNGVFSTLVYGEFDNKILTINGNLKVVGPNEGLVYLSNTTANNTTKGSRMVLNHYSNAEEPVYLFGAASTPTDNFVAFGGGNTIGNATTQIDLFTASNTTTPAGAARGPPLKMATWALAYRTLFIHYRWPGGPCDTGGIWIDASSRDYKDNIEALTTEEALGAIKELNPVKYAYKTDGTEKHVGFIAEDVPELFATKDRKGLSPMDIGGTNQSSSGAAEDHLNSF